MQAIIQTLAALTVTLNAYAATLPQSASPPTVSEMIQQYAPQDFELLTRIAICESGLVQFKKDGSVLRGRENASDTGVFQINLYYHKEKADELGFDLFTTEGNIAYAVWLYQQQGTVPWLASARCWNN